MTHTVVRLALVLAVAFLVSCDETLPGRNDPERVFEARLQGGALVTAAVNAFHLRITVINTSETVLEDTAVLLGSVDITYSSDPTFRTTLPFNKNHLIHYPGYDSRTGRLLLFPGDSVVFAIDWDYTDGSGRNWIDSKFVMRNDPDCRFRFLSGPHRVTVQGSVTLMQRVTDAVIHPSTISFCYVNVYIDKKDCPLPDLECSH